MYIFYHYIKCIDLVFYVLALEFNSQTHTRAHLNVCRYLIGTFPPKYVKLTLDFPVISDTYKLCRG